MAKTKQKKGIRQSFFGKEKEEKKSIQQKKGDKENVQEGGIITGEVIKDSDKRGGNDASKNSPKEEAFSFFFGKRQKNIGQRKNDR
jgi:hypothetical protein